MRWWEYQMLVRTFDEWIPKSDFTGSCEDWPWPRCRIPLENANFDLVLWGISCGIQNLTWVSALFLDSTLSSGTVLWNLRKPSKVPKYCGGRGVRLKVFSWQWLWVCCRFDLLWQNPNIKTFDWIGNSCLYPVRKTFNIYLSRCNFLMLYLTVNLFARKAVL